MSKAAGREATSGVLVVSGPPGAGKSTVAPLFAARQGSPSACIEMDWFWSTITSGYIPPWDPASEHQNEVILRSVAALAKEMADGGYEVVLDGVVGPWNLPLLVGARSERSIPVHYVVLRPGLATCLARASGRANDTPRVPGHPPLAESRPIRHMWAQFADLGRFESHAIDTTDLTAIETAEQVAAARAEGRLRV